MAKGTIVVKLKGQRIPLEMIAAACKDATQFGYAYVSDGEITSDNLSECPDPKELFEAQDEILDQMVVYGFMKYPEGTIQEDEQPWLLLFNDKNDPIVAAFLEGDFSSVMVTDSSHVDAYHLAHDKISPKLKLYYKAAKKDLAALNECIRDDDFRKECAEFFVGGGSATVLVAQGSIHSLEYPPDRLQKFEWGWTNDTCGWSNKPKEETKPEAKSDDIKARMRAKFAKKQTVSDKEANAKMDTSGTGGVLAADKPTDKAVPKTYQEILKKMPAQHPPKDASSNQDLKAWYRSYAGYVPETWKARPAVWSKQQQTEAKLEFARLTGNVPQVSKEQLKDTTAHNLPDTETATDILSAISNGTIRHIGEFRNKFLDKNSQAIPDPNEAKEGDRTTALQRLGLTSWNQLRGLPAEGWRMITHRHDLAQLVMVDMFNAWCTLADASKDDIKARIVAKSKAA